MHTRRGESQSGLTMAERMFVAMLVSGSATQLRFGGVGIAELAALTYLALGLGRSGQSANGVTKDVPALVIGVSLCLGLGAFSSLLFESVGDGVSHDSLAFFLAFSVLIVVARHQVADRERLAVLWRAIIVSTTAILGVTLVVAKVVNRIGPIEFYFHGSNRFQGLAANPNQLPVFIGGLSWLCLHLFAGWKRSLLFFCLLVIGYQTRSDGFLLGQVVAFSGFVVSSVFNKELRSFRGRGLLRVLATLLLVVSVALTFRGYLSSRSAEAVAGGGNGRESLFSAALDRISNMPVFGYGPGSWVVTSSGEVYEAHNNYLDFALRAGLIGLLFLMVFQVKVLKKAFRFSPSLFGSCCALVAYGMTGFHLRWPFYWICWVSVWAFSSNAQEVQQINDKELQKRAVTEDPVFIDQI
jgi:O-antigen ligase